MREAPFLLLLRLFVRLAGDRKNVEKLSFGPHGLACTSKAKKYFRTEKEALADDFPVREAKGLIEETAPARGLFPNKHIYMKRIISLAGILLAGVLAVSAALKPGDDAPNFELKGSDGKTHRLADFKGKQAVVIAWFPKAFTGGCTKQCKAMAEQGAEIKKFDAAYFTASVDDSEQNKKFAESLSLDYAILSDPSKEAAKAFGVLNARGMANRWTFFIGKDGKIAHIDQKVNVENHGRDVAAKLKEMGVAEKK